MVDLELASRQSNWRRKGFLAKVFSPEEQELIITSTTPNYMVWLLWSMKEAAYKAHQREFKSPRKLNWLAQECELKEIDRTSASGIVTVSENTYFTSSEITLKYIYTSAEKSLGSAVKNVILEASPSEAKKKLLLDLSSYFDLKIKNLELKKDESGIPFLEGENSFYFDNFSISGHGRFYAYSLSLINCETSVKQS